MKPQNRTILKSTFRAGITLKAIDGVLEIIGGMWLWLIPPSAMNSVIKVLVEHELSRDPHDFIAIHLLRTSEMLLSSNRLFASMYLLSHGAVKVVLVVALWMNAQRPILLRSSFSADSAHIKCTGTATRIRSRCCFSQFSMSLLFT